MLQTGFQLVRTRQVFQMSPKSLDPVEMRTVSWQPDHPEAMLEQTECCQGRRTPRISRIVHDQNHPPHRINAHQEMLQKGDEGLTVLPRHGFVGNPIATPVIGSNQVMTLLRGSRRSRDRFCCPTFIQQARRGGSSVKVVSSPESSSKSSPSAFFNASSHSAAFSLASPSCKWVNLSFGR